MILSPLPKQQFFDNNGNPADQYKLFTYVAGTSTKQTTYIDSTGTPNTNPIILNYRGECDLWLDPLLTYKFIFTYPNDTDPPTRAIWTVDNIPGGYSGLIDYTKVYYDITPAETAAGVTPSFYFYVVTPEYDFRRYYSGSGDISTAVQTALNVAGAKGRVRIPVGDAAWTMANGVIIPQTAIGGSELIIDGVVNYTGSGYAFTAQTAGTPQANTHIVGSGIINGTASGLGGIRYRGFNRGSIQGITVQGFSTADNIFIDGANAIDIISVNTSAAKHNIRLYNPVISAVAYGAIGIKIIGGHSTGALTYGIYSDCTGGGAANASNFYGMIMDPNTGNAQIFIQGDANSTVSCYFEAVAGATVPSLLIIGDVTNRPVNTLVTGSTFFTNAVVTNSIYDNGNGTIIQGNSELGSPTNFIFGGAQGIGRFIGKNNAPSATNYFAGTDNGDTISIGNAAASVLGSITQSAKGTGMGAITGNTAPVILHARNGTDTQIVSFQDNVGNVVGAMNANGSFRYVAVHVAALPSAATYIDCEMLVDDSSVTTFNSIVAGGGANRMKVKSDGANWRIC